MAITELHVAESAPEGPDPAGGPDLKPPPSGPRTLSALRRAAGERASRLVARALASHGGAGPLARRLEVSTSQVYRWADPEDGDAFTLRDVLAAGGSFARSLLDAVLADVDRVEEVASDDASLQRQLRWLAIDLGRLNNSYELGNADGRLEPHELDDMLAEAQRLINDGNRLSIAIRRRYPEQTR